MTYPDRLLASFKELSGLVLLRETVRSTLDVVAHLAVETIPACDLASISLVQTDAITTVGTSGDVAFALDAIQYETRQGPCLDAINKEASWFRIDEMSNDSRWPAFSSKAAQHGFESLMAFTMRVDQETLGALNLYARIPNAFGEDDVDNGAIFAAHAAVALTRAQSRTGSPVGREDLDEEIVSQELIARAVGILMDRDFRTADEALDLLESRAEVLKLRLRDTAEDVIVTADTERAELALPDGFVDRVMGRTNTDQPRPLI